MFIREFLNKKGLVLACFSLAVPILLFLIPFKVPYKIQSKGLIVPEHEWTLARTIDGNLISSFKNNIIGSISSYSVTEFERGDVVDFRINPDVFRTLQVKKGDTIGILYSNEEERKLIQLQGQYEILKAELKFYMAGKKPEDVKEVSNKLELVRQQLATQKKLMERTEALYKDSLISHQNYEIELNTLKVQEINKNIVEAQYFSVIVGDKPERAELILTKIKALEEQINKIRTRLSFFTLISPIDGQVVLNQGLDNSELLVKIIDTNKYAIILPIELIEIENIRPSSKVVLKTRNFKDTGEGVISRVDNVVQIVDGRQTIFATAIFPNHPKLISGAFSELEIETEKISISEYIARAFGLVLNK
jgi:hypothetical protein